MRVVLVGGKTVLAKTHENQRIVTPNLTNPEMCLVTLTRDYLTFLGKIGTTKCNVKVKLYKCFWQQAIIAGASNQLAVPETQWCRILLEL